MTNKEIISALRIILSKYNEIRKDDAAVNAIEEAIEKINNSYAWIPVEERLPEESGSYLVTYERPDGIRRVDIDDYWTGMMMKDGMYRPEWHTAELTGCKVIAWMPRPKKYNPQQSTT